MARVYGSSHDSLNHALDESLRPRGPDMLFDVAAEYVRPEGRIFDIGCRDARHLIEFVQAHDVQGVGIDPVDRNVERARARVEEAGLGDRIVIANGVMERIEQPGDQFDFIWCRDVLELVEELERALAEAVRVLKRDGAILIYTVFATELLEEREAARIHGPLGNVARNFDEQLVEAAFRRARLAIERKDVIGTEWREYEEERCRRVSRDLLRLARLRRTRAKIVAEHGQGVYELAEASLQWRPYVFLGKLKPTMYVLRRA